MPLTQPPRSRARKASIVAKPILLAVSAFALVLSAAPPVSAAGPVLTDLAGSPCGGRPGPAGFAAQPQGVVGDGAGGYFVSHYAQGAVCHVDVSGNATTYAGNGAMKFGGDGGPATKAYLYSPAGLAYDAAARTLYIADRWNQRVRKVDSNGIITTVAGSGVAGSTGDGGAASVARLNYPTGVALDGAGNLYIADSKNNKVRKVNTDGVITTVAGTGAIGYTGDGGPAVAALLNEPDGLAAAVDGTLYIADSGNHRIRRVSTSGTITAFAGSGIVGNGGDGGQAVVARMWGPASLAVAGDAVLIADSGNNRVRQVSLLTGRISPFAGTGVAGFDGDGRLAVNANLSYPIAIAADAGAVFIADHGNNRVRRVVGGTINTVGGNGTIARSGDGGAPDAAQLYEPLTMTTSPDGNLYIADGLNNAVRRIGTDGLITTVAGDGVEGDAGDGGPAVLARVAFPSGVALDGAGNLLIADRKNDRIRRVSAATGIITTIAGTGVRGFSGDGGPATSAMLSAPSSIAVRSDGSVVIADSGNERIRQISPAGNISTIAGTGVRGFGGDGGPALLAKFNFPTHVILDSAGNVVVTDRSNLRVRRINASAGTITTIAGDGRVGYSPENTVATSSALNYPASVGFDATGAMYIADTGNCIVRRVANPGTPGAVITTVAGWTPAGGIRPTCGYNGANAHPRAVMLNMPTGVTFDGAGRWYIADSLSNRVRLVTP